MILWPSSWNQVKNNLLILKTTTRFQESVPERQKSFLSDVDALRQKHREWKATIAVSSPNSLLFKTAGTSSAVSTASSRQIPERALPPDGRDRRGPPPQFATREDWAEGPPLSSSFGSGRGLEGGMPDTTQPVFMRADMRHAAIPMGLSHTFDSGFRHGPEHPVRPGPHDLVYAHHPLTIGGIACRSSVPAACPFRS
jgi:hypothetical protein